MKKKLTKQAKWQLLFLTTCLPALIFSGICTLGFNGIFYLFLFLALFSISSIVLIIINKKGLFEILNEALEKKEKENNKKEKQNLEELLT